MRALALDYQRSAQPVWASWLLLAIGVVVAVAATFHYVSLSRELSGWEVRTAEAMRQIQRGKPAAGWEARSPEEAARELSSANEILQKLSVPWEALFSALETTRGNRIALLAVEPDVRKAQVRIVAEAKTAKDMLDYLRRLGNESAFSGVVLISHQIQQQDAEQPVRFSLAVNWERKP